MQGRFEILTLTGSFTFSENGGIKSRIGGLSISLAGPDGRVIGGGIAGMLMAATPIQVRPFHQAVCELFISLATCDLYLYNLLIVLILQIVSFK